VAGQVDSDLRRSAVVALDELGRSDDYRDRADAGQLHEIPATIDPVLRPA
jgi:hypothetical protein